LSITCFCRHQKDIHKWKKNIQTRKKRKVIFIQIRTDTNALQSTCIYLWHTFLANIAKKFFYSLHYIVAVAAKRRKSICIAVSERRKCNVKRMAFTSFLQIDQIDLFSFEKATNWVTSFWQRYKLHYVVLPLPRRWIILCLKLISSWVSTKWSIFKMVQNKSGLHLPMECNIADKAFHVWTILKWIILSEPERYICSAWDKYIYHIKIESLYSNILFSNMI
jgi:hypothetical protein